MPSFHHAKRVRPFSHRRAHAFLLSDNQFDVAHWRRVHLVSTLFHFVLFLHTMQLHLFFIFPVEVINFNRVAAATACHQLRATEKLEPPIQWLLGHCLATILFTQRYSPSCLLDKTGK